MSKAYTGQNYPFDVVVPSGSTSMVIQNFNMGGQPVAATASIMLPGPAGASISAHVDYTSLNPTGGTFYFSPAIPATGVYKMICIFFF